MAKKKTTRRLGRDNEIIEETAEEIIPDDELHVALAALSKKRKEHPGLERIGEVMPAMDAVIGIYDRLEESRLEVEEGDDLTGQ